VPPQKLKTYFVTLSGVVASLREAATQSKGPYSYAMAEFKGPCRCQRRSSWTQAQSAYSGPSTRRDRPQVDDLSSLRV